MAFLTPILEDKGFSGIQIGLLSGVKYLAVIVFQSAIAIYCDKHPGKYTLKVAMEIMAVISIGAAFSLYVADSSFVRAIVIFILYGATVNCICPLIESLSLKHLDSGRTFHYGASRASGSFAWAIACVGLGFVADRYGNDKILLVQIAFTLIFIAIGLWIDPVKEVEKTEESESLQSSHSSFYLLTHYHKYMFYLLECVFIFFGFTLNGTFLIDKFVALGGGAGEYGIANFVLALSEIPAAIFITKLRKRFSIEQLMLCCSVFCTLRVAAVTFAPTVSLMILGELFELGGMSLYYAASLYLVQEFLPKEDVVKGMSFINVASMGIGEAVASFISGALLEFWGHQNLLICSVVVTAISIVFGVAMLADQSRGVAKRLVKKNS
ncbi:MAG: MFS transporter [Eubacterium sp.]|nr:MFS transporter [Eubacterium sp.]